MFVRSQFITVMMLFACGACAQKGGDDWSNIDYSKVYRAAGERRDNDARYKSPSVLGCVDDDLFNCR